MSKVWRVAKTEYLNLVRSKAFLVSIILMPVFMGGAITVQTLLENRVDLRDRRLAVVDGTGRLLAGLTDVPQTAEQVAAAAGAPEAVESAFLILEHLAANGRAHLVDAVRGTFRRASGEGNR